MRISDWSSDVCSSDLSARMRSCQGCRASVVVVTTSAGASPRAAAPSSLQAARHRHATAMANGAKRDVVARESVIRERSEEHTSELQSLMRISYAVFCLKNKQQTNNYTKDKKHI